MKNKEYIATLKDKSVADLSKDIAVLRDEARDLRFKTSQNQLKTVRQLRQAKKNIARIKTAINAQGTK